MLTDNKKDLQLRIANKDREIQIGGWLARKMACLTRVKANNARKINRAAFTDMNLDDQVRRVLTEAGIPLLTAYRLIWLLSAAVLAEILRAYIMSPNSSGLMLTRRY